MKLVMKYLIFIVIISACSTIKEIKKDSVLTSIFEGRNPELKNLTLKSTISINMNNKANVATAKMQLANLDSISLILYGPFGILLGKMYADTNNLVFYNTLTNQVIEGKPTAGNMKATVMLPLSYNDFIRLIRCETPVELDKFTIESNINDGEMLYKNDINSEYIEYAVISKEEHHLNQYQRKLRDGTMVLHVFFTNYQKINNISYAMKQLYKFPGINANLTMEVDDIEINTSFEKPFSFSIPSNIERINLNK